jgi:predicted O-linked N-acetylglucosamine transferase (SPINDLY family)
MNGSTAQAAYRQAADAYARGDLRAAELLGRDLLGRHGEHFEALTLLGIVAARTGKAAESVELLQRAVAANPRSPVAHNNLGNALRDLRRDEDALASYRHAIELNPGYGKAQLNLGLLLLERQQPGQALVHLEQAARANPQDSHAHLHRGMALVELGRAGEALESIDWAIGLSPSDAVAHNARGVALRALHRHGEALASYERAIAADPAYAEAHFNRGITLMDLGRADDAAASYERAVVLAPALVEAHNNLGNAYRSLKRYADAIRSYERALELKPDYPFLAGTLQLVKRQICDWRDNDPAIARLEAMVARQDEASPPFAMLALSGSAVVQRQCAAMWAARRFPPAGAPAVASPRSPRERIRVGYFSGDFHEHAMSHLLAELFELHDRARFEIIGFSVGPDRRDPMRERVARAFDRFIDARELSDQAIARASRELGIDIAVDLIGYTECCRAGVFARRAAPVQVNYLGYPGTLGVDYIDYLVADRTLIPAGSERYYAEKIVRMPHTYQVNDRHRRISDQVLSRAGAGLPPSGFVYCCFNNSYKVAPERFDLWMRIMRQVDGSVLWLLDDNTTASSNLRSEARSRGVAAERLVFAQRVGPAEHLARHRLADLFLDTAPYGAHTTASDALWAGLPVLTCPGETFASRVAASLLTAANLPELVVDTPARYEELAVELATDAARLSHLRRKLAGNVRSTPVFDTPRFVRHLESAYAEMLRRWRAGLPADHFDVPA